MKNNQPKKYFNENYKNLDIINVPLKFAITSKKIRARLIEIIKKSRSIVDIGCGLGGTLKVFREINHNCLLFGIDCSNIALRKAKKT
ncbi:MAG: hypothetical protein AAGU06_02810 [Candidatus Shapirobacteria bacterium]